MSLAPAHLAQALQLQECQLIIDAPVARYYEDALRRESGTSLASSGALVAYSGERTGRSPKDKRLVERTESSADIWWGPINQKLLPAAFDLLQRDALAHLQKKERVYVVHGFAGWDPELRLKVRVVCARAYHALFMRNMLITPSPSELSSFGEPDMTIINAGDAEADPEIPGVETTTSVALDVDRKTLIILGTEYAGEMKKGVFTMMNHLMPKLGHLSMHCSATVGSRGDTSILFGLSGTGKTTLSADPKRCLIGDDEHVWSEQGLFNIEGGCYAKAIHLSEKAEPEIFRAIRYGALLENVALDPATRQVDFDDTSITQNTRASYPIDHMGTAFLPCVGGHPKSVIFLTCDAFGVLPPISRLTEEQAMYHFVSGYTAKVAGTEVGVTEPEATFSPCFGGPFLVWHPRKYAELLGAKMRKHGASTYLVNTGWSGGPHGVGRRMDLSVTRAIIDAIHDGKLEQVGWEEDPVFGFLVPATCDGVDPNVLDPKKTWADPIAYDRARERLAGLFRENFQKYQASLQSVAQRGGPRCETLNRSRERSILKEMTPRMDQ
jgi:phosphoenolpyruvate carboxykinase (ATP)